MAFCGLTLFFCGLAVVFFGLTMVFRGMTMALCGLTVFPCFFCVSRNHDQTTKKPLSFVVLSRSLGPGRQPSQATVNLRAKTTSHKPQAKRLELQPTHHTPQAKPSQTELNRTRPCQTELRHTTPRRVTPRRNRPRQKQATPKTGQAIGSRQAISSSGECSRCQSLTREQLCYSSGCDKG